MSPTATSSNTLPNRKEEHAFRTLLFDRERAFMTDEVLRVREALIGSPALIAKAKTNPNPNMLSNLFIKDTNKNRTTFEPFYQYVDALAMADACLRWSGCLPPVTPFAPDQPMIPCHSGCDCKGRVETKDIINFIKTLPKPDWTAFLDYVETQRAAGRAAGKSAQALRLELQRALDKCNDDFLASIGDWLEYMDYPHHEVIMFNVEHDLHQLLNDTKPLPRALLRQIKDREPSELSPAQAQELWKFGESLRRSMARMRREQGNDLFTLASKRTGAHGQIIFAEVERIWSYVLLNGGVEALAAYSNRSAMYFQQKKYERARSIASCGINKSQMLDEEPGDLKTLRWWITEAWRTGELAEVPPRSKRQITNEEHDIITKMRCKLLHREGKAHIKLCREALGEVGSFLSQGSVEQAKKHRAKAMESYVAAATYPDPPTTLTSEITALEKVYHQRMSEQR